MRKYLALLLLLIAVPAYPWSLVGIIGAPEAPGGYDDITGKLIAQDFEGTGYDNQSGIGGSWTEAGTIDEDDTTATVLRGSQQLRVSTGGNYTRADFTASSEVWGTFLMKTDDVTYAGNEFLSLYDTSTEKMPISSLSSSAVRIFHGTQDATTVGILSTNTKYRVWFHWKASTGTDGIAEVWIDGTAATTRPASSGDYYAIESAGTNTGTVNRVRLASSSGNHYFDQLRIDDEEFTTVAE